MSSIEKQRTKALEEINGESATVEIERWNVVSQLMDMYSKDDHVMDRVLQFQFKGELGHDFGGLSRETYSLFWKDCSVKFFEGNDNSFVPRNGLSKEEYITLGKIIHHSYLLTGIFPVCFNQAYIQAILLGDDEVSEQLLLQSYVEYLGPYEGGKLEEILKLSNLDEEAKEFVFELEDRLGMRVSPTISTVRKIVLDMASNELLQLPMHTMSKVKKGMLMSEQGKNLWQGITKEDLDTIYSAQRPTPSKVASLLTPQREDISKEENKMFGYLKRYVKSSDQRKCELLLRFCTASNNIVVEKISVSFFKSVSLEPLPIAHTCGAVLEMPSSGYPTYNNFKLVMDALLENPSSFNFKFA